MSCEHCRNTITEAVQGLPGVRDVQVDLISGELTWEGEGHPGLIEKIKATIRDLGYEHE
jgi:copper chaperone